MECDIDDDKEPNITFYSNEMIAVQWCVIAKKLERDVNMSAVISLLQMYQHLRISNKKL